MSQIVGYIYWGSVCAAVIYFVFYIAPQICDALLGTRCEDCRSRKACTCDAYRSAFLKDLEELVEQSQAVCQRYKKDGWPAFFTDGIEIRYALNEMHLLLSFATISVGGSSVQGEFESIDNCCAFYATFEDDPALLQAVERVKARRNRRPESWPAEQKRASWERWPTWG